MNSSLDEGQTPVVAFQQNQLGEIRIGEVAGTLNTNCNPSGRNTPMIAFHGCQDPDVSGDVTHPLGRNQGQECALLQGLSVRRLTPRECERLQGFPDDYTRIPWRNRAAFACPDGPRYRALGNSMAVPVMRWIGERIERVIRDAE